MSSLTIKWDLGVGQVSRWRNRWYIGERDPVAIRTPRGIPGSVWREGNGRVNVHVLDDPDFVDTYAGSRPHLPYDSTLHALIYPDDREKKLGLLVLDSMDYMFTEYDLALVTQAATRLGWFMYVLEVHRRREVGGGDTH